MAINKESFFLRRRWLFLLLLLLSLSGGGAARAALQFDVFLGYGDIVADASWFPAVFEIRNDGPAFNAVIEISNPQMSQGQARHVPVELPTGR